MLTENDFHIRADAELQSIVDVLDEADAAGLIEVELSPDQLAIIYPGGKTTLISKHGVTKQLWFSSPIQGGLHFSYTDGKWQLPDGMLLSHALQKDLEALGGCTLDRLLNR